MTESYFRWDPVERVVSQQVFPGVESTRSAQALATLQAAWFVGAVDPGHRPPASALGYVLATLRAAQTACRHVGVRSFVWSVVVTSGLRSLWAGRDASAPREAPRCSRNTRERSSLVWECSLVFLLNS
jgi:hypothetical protein